MLYGLLGFVAGLSLAVAVCGTAAACFFARRGNGGAVPSEDLDALHRRERLEKQFENMMRYNGSSNNQADIESDWR